MDDQLLKGPKIEPTNKTLKKEFGDWYPVYKEFASTISSEPYSLKSEWRYYKDGKAWLLRISKPLNQDIGMTRNQESIQ
jgi:hypothetical protein